MLWLTTDESELINATYRIAPAKFQSESSANIKKEMKKKVKFIFIELNSLQIGFITHHQLKHGWASKKVYVRWINAFDVDYKVWSKNKIPHAGLLAGRNDWITVKIGEQILHLFVTPAWCLMDFVRCHYNRKQISFSSAFCLFSP